MAENGIQRKLRAVLSADVNGYSRLMANDDVRTVDILTRYRRIIADVVTAREGRVVDSPGDNLLAEFASSLNAVHAATDIQKKLEEENAKLPINKRMLFRIGINIGDIIRKGERIYGNGVNIAARIENLAEPGVYRGLRKRRHNSCRSP